MELLLDIVKLAIRLPCYFVKVWFAAYYYSFRSKSCTVGTMQPESKCVKTTSNAE